MCCGHSLLNSTDAINDVTAAADRLYLIGFILHQYYEWTDALVDTLLQSVSHFFSQCESRLKEQYYGEREESGRLTQQMTDRSREHLKALAAIRQVVKKSDLDLPQKLGQIEQLIDQYLPSDQDWQDGQQALDELEQMNDRYHRQDAYYEWLGKNSVRLQPHRRTGKVTDLLRLLVVDQTTSQKDLVLALRYFGEHNELGRATPTGFLPLAQQEKILDAKGYLRVSLYKVLLFQQVALAIKSGRLNFMHSYRYRAFERYLIPLDRWTNERIILLERANLIEFADGPQVLATLMDQLREQFIQTNERIHSGENAHVTLKKDNKLSVETPKTAQDTLIQPYELFPTNKSDRRSGGFFTGSAGSGQRFNWLHRCADALAAQTHP